MANWPITCILVSYQTHPYALSLIAGSAVVKKISMTSVSLMEWNPKPNLQWDWENLIMYNDNSNPRKLDDDEEEEEGADWEIAEEKGTPVIHAGSFSSKSASTTSSQTQTPPKMTGYSSEPLLGLKLGKRTYFEDSSCVSNSIKVASGTSVPVNAAAASTTMKRSRSSSSGVPVYCQVEGCNLDLSGAKDYHRKHRVCEGHSKCPKVVVAGLERRFCQQCSRFHSLFEFDEKKRSCRKRLSDHNARRRKPQGESLRFNPSRLHSSIYDERQRMNYGWDTRSPLIHGRPGNHLFWDDSSGSKFTITKECPSNIPIHHHLLGNQPACTQGVEVVHSTVSLNPGGDDGTQDLQRALSLLSTNSSSWGSCEQPSTITSLDTVHATSTGFPQPLSGMPLQSVDAQMRSFTPSQADNSQHHQQMLKGPQYSAEFYHCQL